VGRRGDARPSKIIDVKTRSHRIVSLAVRVVPVAALLVLVEQAPVVLAAGPRGY
jgi:hypothetical protein